MKPVTQVLVVSADEAWRDAVVGGLNAAAERLDNPYGLRALCCPCDEQALQAVLSTETKGADLQVVLIDHGARDGDSRQRERAVRTAQQIIEARPELSLYMLLEDDSDKLLVEQLAKIGRAHV